MRPVVALHLDTPYVTVDKYSKMTGLKESYIKDMVKQGNLPVRPAPKGKTRKLTEINNAALMVEALSGFDVQIHMG